MLTGALLAGGRSRRMGRDKAMLPLDGEPLWRRQARVLREAGAAGVSVVLRQGQPALPGMADEPVRELRDLFPEAGPLAGLHAALSAAAADGGNSGGGLVMLLAVDMPRIDASWFEWLLGFCRAGAGGAAGVGAIAHLDGEPEPLAAVYPAAALPFAEECLAAGVYAMRSLVERLAGRGLLRLAAVPREWREALANCNAPSDYAALPPRETVTIFSKTHHG